MNIKNKKKLIKLNIFNLKKNKYFAVIKLNFFFKYIFLNYSNKFYNYRDFSFPKKIYKYLMRKRILNSFRFFKFKRKIKLKYKKKIFYKKYWGYKKYKRIRRLKKRLTRIEKINLSNFQKLNLNFFKIFKLKYSKIFIRKKYLLKKFNLIYKYFLLNKFIRISDYSLLENLFKKYENDFEKLKVLKKNRFLIKMILRRKKRKNKFVGKLYIKSFNFHYKYFVTYKKNIDFTKIKVNVNEYSELIQKPYKFGKLNISLKHNNIFVNLKNLQNKLIYVLSAGLLKIYGAKKKTQYCREKVIKAVLDKAIFLNYKIIDVYCKFFSKKIFFHISKAIKESDIFVRFFFIKKNNCHGFIRAKKLRRN